MIDTTTQTKHYAPPVGASELNLPQRLAAAYTLARLEVPPLFGPAEAALNDEPSETEAHRRIAEAALSTNDPAEWLEASLAAVTRARAVDELRRIIGKHRAAVTAQHAGRFVRQAAADLTPAFNKAATALCKAAAALPHDAPLDPAAVVDMDATKPWKVAQTALRDLAVYAGIHAPRGRGDISVDLARLAPVLTFPPFTEAQPINRLNRQPLGDVDPARQHVRELDLSAQRDGLDVTLVRVARGDWPTISLALASSGVEVHERTDRARLAISVIPTDSWGPKAVVR